MFLYEEQVGVGLSGDWFRDTAGGVRVRYVRFLGDDEIAWVFAANRSWRKATSGQACTKGTTLYFSSCSTGTPDAPFSVVVPTHFPGQFSLKTRRNFPSAARITISFR